MKRIEPSYPAWEAGVLPLNYTRSSGSKLTNIINIKLKFSLIFLNIVLSTVTALYAYLFNKTGHYYTYLVNGSNVHVNCGYLVDKLLQEHFYRR